jgi:hypothetical protein
MDMIINFDRVQSAEMNSTARNMKLSNVSPSAIRQLQAELQAYQQQANEEMKTPPTRSLGILRLDLIKECRARLNFFLYVIKNAEEQARESEHSRELHGNDRRQMHNRESFGFLEDPRRHL